MIDLEKAEKLPPEHRYFNISVIWIFYYRLVLRLFYWLRVPHELVTILSITFGLFAAYLFCHGHLIAAAVTLHLKDIFDACDGALARLTGRGHIFGRYLDSLGDFVTLTAVILAIGARASSDLYWLLAILAIFSTFIQCSYFNYFQLAYLDRYGIDRLLSKRDEKSRDDLKLESYGMIGRIVLHLLRFAYAIIYGWQDRLIARIDKWLFAKSGSHDPAGWYGDKTLMVWRSTLCFGTHIFAIIVFTLAGKPEYSLIFIGTIMNLYLFYLMRHRVKRFKAAPGDANNQNGWHLK
jgi:phosphatidylglycerophosphate synthase